MCFGCFDFLFVPTLQGHLRKGQALMKLRRYREAMITFAGAAEKEPSSSGIRRMLDEANRMAARADRESPVRSVDHWKEIFMYISGPFN